MLSVPQPGVAAADGGRAGGERVGASLEGGDAGLESHGLRKALP